MLWSTRDMPVFAYAPAIWKIENLRIHYQLYDHIDVVSGLYQTGEIFLCWLGGKYVSLH